MYYENYIKLKKQLNIETKFAFNHKIIYSLLPFRTRSIKEVNFSHGCLPIIGVLGRITLGKQLELQEEDAIVNYMLGTEDIDFEYGEDEQDFKLLLQEYLGGIKLNIFNPYLFLFVPLFDLGIENLGVKMAQFINEVFFKDIDLSEFFSGKNTNDDNIILEFIISNLKDLKEEKNKSEEYFVPKCMENVVDVIRNDFLFLLSHEDFLVKNFDLIISFYLNFYFTQFVLKNSSFDDSKNLMEAYYVLDWERVSKNRGENPKGYKLFEKHLSNLLYSMEIVEHLNTLLGTNSLLIPELVTFYDNLNKKDQEDVLKYFKKIMIDMVNSDEKIDESKINEIEGYQTFKELINYYEDFLKDFAKKLDRTSPFTKYHDGIEKLCTKYFVKGRGRYSNMFNITQDMLMVITAISIQYTDKIRFNKLIEEFRRRGLFFDEESSTRIKERFNTLNLIDTKSDIGDEAYVKSIL